MIIIGLCGRAGAGKGTVSNVLCRTYGLVEMAFADPLYEAVAAITRLTEAELKDRDNKEKPIPWCGGKSPRYLLQTLGTEWGRKLVGDDIWVEATMRRVRGLEGIVRSGVVLTDVRFDNEAAAIHSLGGRVWQVTRDDGHRLDGDTAAHESERGVSACQIDGVVENGGTIDDLRANAVAAFRRQFRTGIGVLGG